MKPQSIAEALDGADASPHPSGMEPKDKDGKGSADSREAKLAAALRANLRRRKAAAPAGESPKKSPPASD